MLTLSCWIMTLSSSLYVDDYGRLLIWWHARPRCVLHRCSLFRQHTKCADTMEQRLKSSAGRTVTLHVKLMCSGHVGCLAMSPRTSVFRHFVQEPLPQLSLPRLVGRWCLQCTVAGCRRRLSAGPSVSPRGQQDPNRTRPHGHMATWPHNHPLCHLYLDRTRSPPGGDCSATRC